MVRKKLVKTDESYIINFLTIEDEPQDIKVLALLLNILFSAIAVYHSENRVFIGLFFLVINVFSISMLVRALKKKLMKWNEKYLYHGSYVWILSLNLIIIAYLFYNKQHSLENDNMIIGIVLSYILIIVITCGVYIVKISKNDYESHSNLITASTISSVAVLANGRILKGWEENFIWFIIAYLLAMFFVSKSTYYLLRAYCFSLVDEERFNERLRECNKKIAKENATFNRYGTKKHKKL